MGTKKKGAEKPHFLRRKHKQTKQATNICNLLFYLRKLREFFTLKAFLAYI